MDWLTPWRNDGIAMGEALNLLPPSVLTQLRAAAEAVRADRFAALQASLESKGRANAKSFLKQWLGRFPIYDPQSIWAEVARHLTPLAAEHLGARAILRFYNLWDITPSAKPPSRSQLWHRDHEDVAIAKAFLYLSDVTNGAGPLVYARGTHARGAHAAARPETFVEPGSGWIRSTDAQLAAVVPASEWTIATGPIGTLVLADTAGYHKGGHATTTPRLVATWEWTTPQAKEGSRFHRFGPQP